MKRRKLSQRKQRPSENPNSDSDCSKPKKDSIIDQVTALVCTDIRAELLETNELQIVLKIKSINHVEILKLFNQQFNLSSVNASIVTTENACSCVDCGKKLESSWKVLSICLSNNEKIAHRCGDCSHGNISMIRKDLQVASPSDSSSGFLTENELISSKPKINNVFNEKTSQLKREKGVGKFKAGKDTTLTTKKRRLDDQDKGIPPDDDREEVSQEELVDDPGFVNTDSHETHLNETEEKNVTEKSKVNHSCKICGKTLLNAKTLKSHMATHTPGQNHSCQVCHRKFAHVRYLKKHEKTHLSDKPYICEVCGKRFKLKESLPKHMVLHREIRPFKCVVCNKQFHLEEQMKKHASVHSNERKYICELCGKRFRTQGCMKSHKATHDGPLKHKCEQCGKTYRSAWYLKIHEKTHTGENLIQCKLCNDWFIDPCYFKLHQKKFCKGKTLTCDKCGLQFPHNQALQSHMGLHTGTRPFGCKTCGKAFAKSSLLAEHVKRHTLENCLKCQYCKKGFINMKELKRHEKCHVSKKKKASLPENLKPGRSEQIENFDESEVVIENPVQEIETINEYIPNTGYVQVDIVESGQASLPQEGVSHTCVQYIQDHTEFHPTDSISLGQAGASTQILSSHGGHITIHEPISIANDYSSEHLTPSTVQFSGPSFTLPPPAEPRIISTSTGELQQLQPVTAVADNISLACESETSVHHLLQAAAVIKNYPSQF